MKCRLQYTSTKQNQIPSDFCICFRHEGKLYTRQQYFLPSREEIIQHSEEEVIASLHTCSVETEPEDAARQLRAGPGRLPGDRKASALEGQCAPQTEMRGCSHGPGLLGCRGRHPALRPLRWLLGRSWLKSPFDATAAQEAGSPPLRPRRVAAAGREGPPPAAPGGSRRTVRWRRAARG
uniref:Uncharacterized protein n=1 Tax=Myotis myotis TaxID=51298 RepID=A0A7J7XI02_MYOMY|nr:hypothetical protein mMyoMyo1_011704 [Myotis myotis]